MLGAIIGDVVGSRFEFSPIKTKDFELFDGEEYKGENKTVLNEYSDDSHFTDDTVMTVAVCKALMDCNGNYANLREKVVQEMQDFGRRYPWRGYGLKFQSWLNEQSPEPYNSFGNGSAMRVAPVAYFAKNLKQVKELSLMVTDVTHNHPEGIKGAEATAVCVWLALHKKSKKKIKKYIEKHYYSLDFDYDDLVKNYSHKVTCQESVPQSIFGFLISNSFEDAIRTVVSMGGDADTMGAIAGAIAEAFYGIPTDLEEKTKKYLPKEFLEILNKFNKNNYLKLILKLSKIKQNITCQNVQGVIK